MDNQRSPSRRSFLKGLAALAGATVTATATADRAPSENIQQIRVTLVAPGSERTPQLASELLHGMSLGLSLAGARDRVIIEHQEVSGLPSKASRIVAERVEARAADLIVTLAQPATVPALAAVVERARVPLLALDAGANIPRNGESSPYVFTQTLGMWRAAWAAGAWAAHNVGTSAAIIGSFYDLGYDLAFAFEAGFKISGAVSVSTLMTDAPEQPGRHDWPATLTKLRSLEPQVIYLLNSDGSAAHFLGAYAGRARVLTTQVVVEPTSGSVHASLSGLLSMGTWAANRHAEREKAIRSGLSASRGSQPGCFARLGFDAGVRIGSALASDASLLDALAAGESGDGPSGPRGRAGSEAAESPMYLRETIVGPYGAEQRWIADAPAGPLRAASLASLVHAPRTGWVYPYLTA